MNLPDGKWYDWWMVPHFFGWAIIMGWLSWFFAGALTLPLAVIVLVGGSILWEVIEYVREGILGYQREPWTNRLVVDPIVNTAGGLTGWWVYNSLL